MGQTYRSRVATVLKRANMSLSGMFDGLIANVSRELMRNVGDDGVVPIARLYDVQRYAGEQVMGLFVSRWEGQRLSFSVLPDGTPYPLSPYARIIFTYVRDMHRIPVEYQANDMRKRLKAYPSLISALETSAVVSELNLGLRPNPFIKYDPTHTWVDPAGYTLSERIWRTGGTTRRKLDLFLEDHIRKGFKVEDIVSDLEKFLKPGRYLPRNTGYGTTGSFDATRLLHTELKRAESAAAEIVAQLNPFIEEMSVVLSPSHPVYDICDVAAAASPFPKDDIPPTYRIPLHPLCMCHYEYGWISDSDNIIDRLRRNAVSGIITALLVDKILRWLFFGWSIKAGIDDE